MVLKTVKKIIDPVGQYIRHNISSGILLLLVTAVSITLANTNSGEIIKNLLNTETHLYNLPHTVHHWINDGLMAVFFLLVGLEIKREFMAGELSSKQKAALPIIAALGGMLVPALIYNSFNALAHTKAGWGIPMATDIAFAVGIITILGDKVPLSLKIFLTALAVIDDLGAVAVIAIFYTSQINLVFLSLGFGIFALLLLLNKLKIQSLFFYLPLGAVMWYFILQSGIHATVAGVLLAVAIPFNKDEERNSPLEYLEHTLHNSVNYFIMPIFAFANTGVQIKPETLSLVTSSAGIGIILGLILGKPLGIVGFSYLAKKINLVHLPHGIKLRQMLGVGFLGGIGFTMSIFISLLAFNDDGLKQTATISIICASLFAGLIGYVLLNKKQI